MNHRSKCRLRFDRKGIRSWSLCCPAILPDISTVCSVALLDRSLHISQGISIIQCRYCDQPATRLSDS